MFKISIIFFLININFIYSNNLNNNNNNEEYKNKDLNYLFYLNEKNLISKNDIDKNYSSKSLLTIINSIDDYNSNNGNNQTYLIKENKNTYDINEMKLFKNIVRYIFIGKS